MNNLIANIDRKYSGQKNISHDMVAGVVKHREDNNRYFYMTSQFILSLYDVLKYEVSDAWENVLKDIGKSWGQRLYIKLADEYQENSTVEYENISLKDYFSCLSSYLSYCGLARVRVDLDNIDNGIVIVNVKGSIIRTALKNRGETNDALMAGLLLGLFESMSENKLGCMQINNGSSSESIFVLTGNERMEFRIEKLKKTTNAEEAVAILNT